MIKCCMVYELQDGKCRQMPLCNHIQQMANMPQWVYGVIERWEKYVNTGVATNIDPFLIGVKRMKFKYPARFMGAGPLVVYSGIEESTNDH